LLRRLLSAESHQARAAATHVLRYTYREIPDSTELFLKAANDPHGRVRLEAIVAASWLDNSVGVQIALEALRHPIDTWMAPVFETIMKETLSDDLQTLKDADQLSLTDNPAARDFLSGTLHIPIPELESAEVTPTR